MMRLFLILLITSTITPAPQSKLCAHEVIITKVIQSGGFILGYIKNGKIKLQITETLFSADGSLNQSIQYDIEADNGDKNSPEFKEYEKKLNDNSDLDIFITREADRIVDFREGTRNSSMSQNVSNIRTFLISSKNSSNRYIEKGYSCEKLKPHISFGFIDDSNTFLSYRYGNLMIGLKDSYKWNMLSNTTEVRPESAAELRELNKKYDFSQFALPK